MQKVEERPGHHSELIPETAVQDLNYIASPPRNGYRILKRTLDIVLAVCGLLVLLLPMAVVALAVYIDDPGSVIFSQYRVGRYGKQFKLYKFRTMRMDAPQYLATAEVDDPDRYITRVGRFFRRTSLDELPQLWNVLVGDMSLVGPRPLIPNEQEIHEMRTRFGVYNIRPGVTGLAQINGRDLVSPADKVRLDVKYVETFSLHSDVKILFKTLPKIWGAVGIAEGGTKQDGGSRRKS